MKKLNKCDFSFRHYKEILEMLKKQGYEFCFFNSPSSRTKRVYLRHDIDYSPERALEIAKIEKQLGVSSTFFVRLNSPFYNMRPKEIADLGHQIGLHFEKGEIKKQLEALGTKIVSFHRPSESVINKKFNGFISTYEPRFFRDIKYFSDSKGVWREGCICQQESLPSILHINMHPIWWDEKEGSLDPQKRLEEYAKTKDNMINLLKNDNAVFRP